MRDEFHRASSCYFMRGQDLLCLWRWHTLIGLWEIRAWRTVSLPPNLLPPIISEATTTPACDTARSPARPPSWASPVLRQTSRIRPANARVSAMRSAIGRSQMTWRTSSPQTERGRKASPPLPVCGLAFSSVRARSGERRVVPQCRSYWNLCGAISARVACRSRRTHRMR